MSATDYPITIQPLPADDGGGYLATFPDLPGCMADGETPEEAMAEATDAATSWLKTSEAFGDPIPEPGSGGESGSFVARLPKSLHAKLKARAAQEGVSLNMLVVSFLSEKAA